MSAIAGIFFFYGAPVEPGLIEKLTVAMKSRGPDEQTHWVSGSMALGHCMLRTTPESLEERQPLIGQHKNIVLVWDGRLDNRDELRANLISAGAILRDNSDAEMALQSYAIWGEECPKQLLGDFAFAVWDANQGKLFCARDPMGARPFYYTQNDRFFAFASEDEVLLNLPGVSNKPNEELIAYFLVQNFLDLDYTHSWLEAVWALMSAQYMTVSPDRKIRKHIYWHLQPEDEAKYTSDEECQQAFLDIFGEAVRCRMRSIGDVSAMMSGGLDSASIAAMVKRVLPEMPGKAFHTYSAISDHPETCVETQCILGLTGDLGSNAHFVSVPSLTGMPNIQDLIDAAWTKPHPVDNDILLPMMMCVAASRNGHRVMLHGVSGDITMHTPNNYIAFILRTGHWIQAWKECNMASRNNTYLRGGSPISLLLRNMWVAYMPGSVKLLARRFREKHAKRHLLQSMINPRFAKRLRIAERVVKQIRSQGPTFLGTQQTQIKTLLPPHNIESGLTAYDRVAGRYGIELRDPWGDRRLVEFWVRLPLKHKVREGWTKYLARTAFAQDIGAEIRWRLGKEHLGHMLIARLMDESRGLVEDVLTQGLGAGEEYIDNDCFHVLLGGNRTAEFGHEALTTYDTMIVVLWLRRLGVGLV